MSTAEDTQSVPPLSDDAASLDSNGAKVIYKYKDYGGVAEDEDLTDLIPDALPITRNSGESSIRAQKFPVKLYSILSQPEFHEIITWMPQ